MIKKHRLMISVHYLTNRYHLVRKWPEGFRRKRAKNLVTLTENEGYLLENSEALSSKWLSLAKHNVRNNQDLHENVEVVEL